jgi:hypothetical protein
MAPIVFGILAHDKPHLVAKNLETYYREDCFYLIHVDRKHLSDWTASAAHLPANVRVISRNFVSWASIGILDTTIDLIDEALATPGWQRFCLVSGQDVAVVQRDKLIQDLLEQPSRVAEWNRVEDWEKDPAASVDEPGWGAALNPGQCPEIFNPHFRSAAVHPDLQITNANHLGKWRFGYDYSVDPFNNSIFIKPLPKMARQRIDNWFGRGKNIAVGSARVTLDKELAEFCVKSRAALETYDLVKSFLFPDEAYFQSILSNHAGPRILRRFERLCCSHTHFSYEDNGKVTPSKIEEARNAGFLFCRKHLPSTEDSPAEAALSAIHGDRRQLLKQ